MNTASPTNPKSLTWLPGLYLVALMTDIVLVGMDMEQSTVRLVSKSVLMPVLAIYLCSMVRSSIVRTIVLLALFFSWMGDIILWLGGVPRLDGELFFMLGLASFLVAHIFYILFFHRLKKSQNIPSKWWLVLIVAVYYFGLIVLLSPYLGKLALPVRVYGIVISFMLLLALHGLWLREKRVGILFATGALLFVISDSILAFNKFHTSFGAAGILIMLTYGLAQFLLVRGVVAYVKQSTSPK